MQYSTLLSAVAVTLLSATSVSATCFNSGANWGNHAPAKFELTEACKEMKGHYNGNQRFAVCRNSGGNSYVFAIKNTHGYGVEVNEGSCYSNIAEQIDNCGHGGKVTRGGIQYSGDPNDGSC